MKLEYSLPIATQSEANVRGAWQAHHGRKVEQRECARLYTLAQVRTAGIATTPLRVTLTRIAPRELDDDNLRRALKAVRDGIAKALGVDDGRRGGISWCYETRRGRPHENAVTVVLDWNPTGCPRCGYEAQEIQQ